jgi:hypothetical protein
MLIKDFLFPLFIGLVFSLSSAFADDTIWHQQYEPAENEIAYKFALEAFEEAKKILGEPVVPVRQMHIRRSVKRINMSLITRGDILEWRGFCARITDYPPFASLMGKDAVLVAEGIMQTGKMDFASQIKVVNAVNYALINGKFGGDEKKGFFSRFFKKSQANRNRNTLDKIAGSTLLKYPPIKKVRKGIELCEEDKTVPGKFILYVRAKEGTPEFYLELAHEVNHLLNANIFDWYTEGLGNVFAEHMAKKTGRDWTPWEKHFRARKSTDPYAAAYYMMRGVWIAAGDRRRTIQSYTMRSRNGKLQIDIDSWLKTLDPKRRRAVLDAISPWVKILDRIKGNTNTFKAPVALEYILK